MEHTEIETIPVLDEGFVRYVDHMGSDSRIVQAARVSYGAGTKTVREDKGLIDYLIRNYHTSPLEMCEITFHMKMPIFVARQLVRHRTANLNEYSARYSEMPDSFFEPEFRIQNQVNKQGSLSKLSENSAELAEEYEELTKRTYKFYQTMLGEGVSREIARTILPVSVYTEMYWKMDLNNLFKFLKLRLDPHAQKEIVVFADAIGSITKQLFPFAYESFEEHVLYAKQFSKTEVEIIQPLILKEIDNLHLTERQKRILLEKLQ